MQTVLKISEAGVIALHAVDLLAREPGGPHSAAGMAGELGVSYNHLSKVLQRLARAGFVIPQRGPKGGFVLAEKTGGAALKDVLEAIEGPLVFAECLMKKKVCGRKSCLFSGLLAETNKRLEKELSRKVSVFANNK